MQQHSTPNLPFTSHGLDTLPSFKDKFQPKVRSLGLKYLADEGLPQHDFNVPVASI
jgi:hypothetical protein